MSDVIPRSLVVVNGQVQLQQCALYASHKVPIINAHHVAPLSWWLAKGLPVSTPMANCCPNCHAAAHTAIDSILAGRDVSLLPPRCVALARQALTIAAEHGLTPAPTL